MRKVVRVDDAGRMIELLRYANRAAVARALAVSTQTANQWAKGRDVTPARLRQVEDLLRPDLAAQPEAADVDLLDEMRAIRRMLEQRTAPPWWGEAEARLAGEIKKTRDEIRGVIVPQSLVERMQELLAEADAQGSPEPRNGAAQPSNAESPGAAAGKRSPGR